MDRKPVRGISVLRKNKRRRSQQNESGEITARRNPVYPISAERELARATLAYTDTIINTTQPFVDRLMRQYEDRSYRQDAVGDFISAVRGQKFAAAEKLSKKTGAISKLEKGYKFSGNLAKKHSIDDWNDQVKDALGMQVNKEWYSDNMEYMIDNWIRTNVSKIQSIPAEYLTEVENIIRWGYETRQPKVNVYRRLEKLIGLSKSKAMMIARDQLGTLNYQMTRFEAESAGCGKYRWITKRDNRVRDSHRELHGTIQKWSDPPAMWYWTKSRGRVYTGRFCHAGEDYGCRCVAKPIFDLESAKELLAQKFRPL
jgi:SPP1 gp7 family putative phage head morphogenesis protein